MRDLNELNRFRNRSAELQLYGVSGAGGEGCFQVPFVKEGRMAFVIASSGAGWEHVSVSFAHRCPTWAEMERIKRLFFREDETAMQLHVPQDEHINCHPHCLHLWRPIHADIPRPPAILVGVNVGGTTARVELAREGK